MSFLCSQKVLFFEILSSGLCPRVDHVNHEAATLFILPTPEPLTREEKKGPAARAAPHEAREKWEPRRTGKGTWQRRAARVTAFLAAASSAA